MPTSQPYQISKIINAIIALDPKSILDIGPGFGNYGVLSRAFLDIHADKEGYNYLGRRIDCVEPFEGYLTPLHDFIYNNIYRGDALEVVDKLDSYDLVLLVDVLEHFTKEKAISLVEKLLKKNRGLLISIPKNVGFRGEGTREHNKYEEHRSQWNKLELARLGKHLFIADETSHIVYIGNSTDVKILSKQLVKNEFLRTLKKYLYYIPGVVRLYNYWKKKKIKKS